MVERLTLENFKNRAQKIHKNKYNYSQIKEIKNNHTEVCIICPENGEFWQRPDVHLRGFGCSKCSKTHKYTTEEWINMAKQIRGEGYFGYDKVEYKNARTYILIYCKKHKTYFPIIPREFIRGSGCPICKQSKMENQIEKILKTNNIVFIKQYNVEWLGKKKLDFYLPDYNIGIECQGRQHYEIVTAFGGEEEFLNVRKRDKEKQNECKENNIRLIYYLDKKFVKYLDANDEYIINKEDILGFLK